MSEKTLKRSSPSLNQSTSVRRTSSQYHQRCLSGVKGKSGNVSPKPLESPISSRSPTCNGIQSSSCSPKRKSIEQPKITSTPIMPPAEVKMSIYTIRKSNLLFELSKIFESVPIDEELDELKDDTDEENLSFCGKLISPQSSPALSSSSIIVSDENMNLLKALSESWKAIAHSSLKEKCKVNKVPIGAKIVQVCNEIHSLLEKLDPKSPKIESKLLLLMSLSSLRELVSCWLTTVPMSNLAPYEEAIEKVTSCCYKAVGQIDGEFSEENMKLAQRSSLKSMEKIIYLVGKRLLEINASLDESVWAVLSEGVMDSLVKGSSTQFSYTLHSLIDQVSTSQMHVSSLAYQSFQNKKSESVRSLLEVSIELLDEIQQVMRKFKVWHEFHNGENTLSKCYEIQFLWHSENFQYLRNLHSLILDYTQNVTKVLDEPASVSELPALERILNNLKSNLNGIQKSLPFSSSEPETDHDFVSESMSLLNDLESSIRNSIAIIGRQTNVINTSFICCKGILKKSASHSSCIELSSISDEQISDDCNANVNRRVHFSESVLDADTKRQEAANSAVLS